MVLGPFEKGITYPKSLYYSGSAYNLAYAPKGLWFENVAHWDDANNKWLASLFGLSHERILPEKITDEKKGWEEYLDRIWRYLQQGSPVQIIKGWESKVEKGQVFHTGMGWRTYWWEGATFTSSHYFTVVGMDESEGILYINDAAYVSAEYLEEKGMMREWEWLFKHRMLYEKLRVPTAKLRSVFKSTEDIDQAVEMSTPLLVEMRQTIDEMISHVERYPGVT